MAFFGLISEIIPQYRASLFTQIHEIVFHGQGGYDWGTVYNIPIWLRKFTFHKMKEYYEKQIIGQFIRTISLTDNTNFRDCVFVSCCCFISTSWTQTNTFTLNKPQK